MTTIAKKPIDKKKKEFEDSVKVYLTILRDRLTGGRAKKKHTVEAYVNTFKNFLYFVGRTEEITAADVDHYIAARRSQGITEITLRTDITRLKKANQVCEFFKWNFTRDDIPTPGEDYVAATPTFTPERVEQFIRAQKKYTDAERFYLAISTTFACRREALAQIQNKHIDPEAMTITVPGVHRNRSITHLIPPMLKDIILKYHTKHRSGQAMSEMFHRIAAKAGIELPAAKTAQGFGWHSIRRCVSSMAEHFIPQCKGPDGKFLPQSVWADYTGWSKSQKGTFYMGSAMAGHYSHQEVLNNDKFWMDRCIYRGHPFLKIWEEELKTKKVKK